ncbi:hypothetical protein PHLGIDRAFT_344370 [Phlebiopsis gigantea 11061_1 CR5-6]|uniref:Uncharacterized protein n=1 Tax=Phlebiopsis gigantea (strain 11061_1 CR5-6) TaxID=745531 RepID=A0A0C3PA40_PHLG1|nr:hypothetical protein PHLGIDRAFT_344370 [Phlebiopsis gigantea 11061_1 CR5-6]
MRAQNLVTGFDDAHDGRGNTETEVQGDIRGHPPRGTSSASAYRRRDAAQAGQARVQGHRRRRREQRLHDRRRRPRLRVVRRCAARRGVVLVAWSFGRGVWLSALLASARPSTSFVPEPASVGGSDLLLLHGSIESGANRATWREALYLHTGASDDDWADVEVRCLWWDRSVYEASGRCARSWRRQRRRGSARAASRWLAFVVVLTGCAASPTGFSQPDWERLFRALLAEETEGL